MEPGDKKSAKQWALRALGRRMHTAYEIRAGLAKRGYTHEAAEAVVEDLAGAGYLSDLDFARTWVASRSTHQMHGRLRLQRDLKQKGVPEEIIETVLKDSFEHEDEVEIAIKAARKKERTMRSAGKSVGAKGRDALYRHLRSRGFTSRAISAAMSGIDLMDPEEVYQAGCTPGAHPGAGGQPGEFTSLPRQARDAERGQTAGGGSRPGVTASQNRTNKSFARLPKIEEDSS